jgi:hypothetical protein
MASGRLWNLQNARRSVVWILGDGWSLLLIVITVPMECWSACQYVAVVLSCRRNYRAAVAKNAVSHKRFRKSNTAPK